MEVSDEEYEEVVHEHCLWVNGEPDLADKTLTRMLQGLPSAEVLESEARHLLHVAIACSSCKHYRKRAFSTACYDYHN